MSRTASELLFESFCDINGLAYVRVPEAAAPAPDYHLTLGQRVVHVEVKQIDKDENFTGPSSTRTAGAHVRAEINEARARVRPAAEQGLPAILLSYNNLDPMQAFGTEPHDFTAGMYGDLTIDISLPSGQRSEMYHGRNKALRDGKNDSFSAVGWLYRGSDSIGVHLYENMHARVPLDFEALPPCIAFNRVSPGSTSTPPSSNWNSLSSCCTTPKMTTSGSKTWMCR